MRYFRSLSDLIRATQTSTLEPSDWLSANVSEPAFWDTRRSVVVSAGVPTGSARSGANMGARLSSDG
jgi:hypothetical protein